MLSPVNKMVLLAALGTVPGDMSSPGVLHEHPYSIYHAPAKPMSWQVIRQ